MCQPDDIFGSDKVQAVNKILVMSSIPVDENTFLINRKKHWINVYFF